MANRYWVGGTGTWDSSSTAHWSASSGGATGASVPVPTDNVFFDANSFSADGQILTLDSSVVPYTANLNLSGVAFNVNFTTVYVLPAHQQINVRGDFNGSSKVTLATNVDILVSPQDASSHTFQSNGMVFPVLSFDNILTFSTVTILDNLVATSLMVYSGIILDANDFNVTFESFYGTRVGIQSPTVIMGSGTWTLRPTVGYVGPFYNSQFRVDGVVITPETSIFYIDFSLLSSGEEIRIYGPEDTYTFNTIIIDGANISGVCTLNTSNINSTNFSIINPPIQVTLGYSRIYTFDNFVANGSVGNIIKLRSLFPNRSDLRPTISSSNVSVSFVDVQDNIAQGIAIPFDDRVGGVDSGDNTNWLFASQGNEFLQNVFFVAADTDGNVQMVNIGKSDDTDPIFYELETQDLEFSNRMHYKEISDKMVIFNRFSTDSSILVQSNDGDYKPIPVRLDGRVNIAKNIDIKGNYFKFKWLGESTTDSPVLEGIYLEDINDVGMTHG